MKTPPAQHQSHQAPSLFSAYATWMYPILVVMVLSLTLFFASGFWDFLQMKPAGGFLSTLLFFDAESAQSALGNIPQVQIGILGLTLTVVAIVVQLAAQRYTPKLVDLFLADRVNIFMFLGFVMTSVYGLWVLYSVRHAYVPVGSGLLLIVLASLMLAVLIPYFRYVFQFLTPSNILGMIEASEARMVREATRETHPAQMERLKLNTANGLEQVSDIALSAVNQVDRNVALMSIASLSRMIRAYLPYKKQLSPAWFVPQPGHFISLSAEFLQEIADRRIWVETRCLMNMELLFTQGLKTMPDAISAVATDTRQIALTALDLEDEETLYLCMEYFNTFLRRAVNDRNQRAVFTLFYQYRRLAEDLLIHRPGRALEIAEFLNYYGQEAQRSGIPFLMLVAAMDLGTLIQYGVLQGQEGLEPMLDLFLNMSSSEEVRKVAFVHKGVRKAHVILATHLLGDGNHKTFLERIRQSLAQEEKAWLAEVKRDLLGVEKEKFWEITDRGGINFEYLTPEEKKHMETFYAKYLEG